jgi:hypothetical protein
MPNEYSGRPTEGGLFCERHRETHLHMPTHKFRVGQLVQLFPAISRNVPGGLKRSGDSDKSVDEPDYNDGSQNEHPIGNFSTRYRRCPAKPFHDGPSQIE